MTSGKVLIAAPVHPVLTDGLRTAGYELVAAEKVTQKTAPVLIHDCTGVITSTRLQLDRSLLDAAPRLRWIGRMGSGMEVIDVPYATTKGIACHASPEGNCNAVAEHATGMLLSLIRHIRTSQAEIADGRWLREENRGTELEGKTIGIVGFGHTGRAFARKLQGFDMRILAYDKYDRRPVPDYVIPCSSLEEILTGCDILSFHVPQSAETEHYFNNALVAKTVKPFILINTSRGQVVNSFDLKAALDTGKVTGACLDVWEQEPLDTMSPPLQALMADFVQRRNVVITPHIAGYTFEALYKMSNVLLSKICAIEA